MDKEKRWVDADLLINCLETKDTYLIGEKVAINYAIAKINELATTNKGGDL